MKTLLEKEMRKRIVRENIAVEDGILIQHVEFVLELEKLVVQDALAQD